MLARGGPGCPESGARDLAWTDIHPLYPEDTILLYFLKKSFLGLYWSDIDKMSLQSLQPPPVWEFVKVEISTLALSLLEGLTSHFTIPAPCRLTLTLVTSSQDSIE